MATLNSIQDFLRNGTQICFRTVVAGDAETHLSLSKQIPYDSTHTMQYIGRTYPSLEEVRERLRTNELDRVILSIGAFDQQKLVGYLNFRMPNPDHPWFQHLGQFGMMVLKEYWGLGIGKKLLELQELHTKSIGITRIEANVRVANERGVKLYTRAGYKIEGTRAKAALIDGQYHDEYYIAKIFADSYSAP